MRGRPLPGGSVCIAAACLALMSAPAYPVVCMLPLETGDERIANAWFTKDGLLLRTDKDHLLHNPSTASPGTAALPPATTPDFASVKSMGKAIQVRQVYPTPEGTLIQTYGPPGSGRSGVFLYRRTEEDFLRQLDDIAQVAGVYHDSNRVWLLTESGIYQFRDGELRQLSGLDGRQYFSPRMHGSGDRLFLSVEYKGGEGGLYRIRGDLLEIVPDWPREIVAGSRDLGTDGLLLWTLQAIYRLDGTKTRHLRTHRDGLPPEDICATGAGALVVYQHGGSGLLTQEGYFPLYFGGEANTPANMGIVHSVHRHLPETTTLTASEGVFDLRDDSRGELEHHLSEIGSINSAALEVTAGLVFRDSSDGLYLRTEHELVTLAPPEGEFRGWDGHANRLWVRTDRGLNTLSADRRWLMVRGELANGQFKLLPRSDESLCAEPDTGEMAAGALQLLVAGKGGLARIVDAPLEGAQLALAEEFKGKISPRKAGEVRWRIVDMPCESVDGAVTLHFAGTGPKGKPVSRIARRLYPDKPHPWVFNLSDEIPERGVYTLDFELRAGDGSDNVHALGRRHVEIDQNVSTSIRNALAHSWKTFRSLTPAQQGGLLASALLLLAAIIAFAVWRHRLRSYRKVRIFISYRRADSRTPTRKLYRELKLYFASDLLFRDRESIEWGSHFPRRIFECLKSSQVVLVMIGREWSTIRDEAGRRRLEMPEDFVRKEVLYALENNKFVVPILVEETVMPQDLPKELADLALLDAMELALDTPHFEHQVRQLAILLRKKLGMPSPDDD